MPGSEVPTVSPRLSAPRQAGMFLAITYVLALGIALALPRAGIAPLLSIAVAVIAVALTVQISVGAGRRRSAWPGRGFGMPSWRALLVAVVGPLVIVG